jgi:hypothetical protein
MDAASGWLFAALRGAGLELGAISLATIPVTAGWLALALALGHVHERRTRASGLHASLTMASGTKGV